jgi:hypothetical protein
MTMMQLVEIVLRAAPAVMVFAQAVRAKQPGDAPRSSATGALFLCWRR